ncbi:CD276 antigen homolog [Paramisgurnus dabryanus]|uniref:CD276 antigen homolog n=1 Tax=Paramisgurnus dabryanus TaxID=90735 RepID=UPI0031F40237
MKYFISVVTIVRIFIVFLFIQKASLDVTVEGVVGGSVVLPCSGKAHQGTPEDLDVFWRHKESMVVYNIIKGNASVEKQELQYKNRTESFPENYLKGNFSLLLKKLQETDAGKYSCLIGEESIIRKVELLVKAKSEDQNNNQADKSKDNNNQGAQTRPEMIAMFLLPISILVFM